MSIRTKIGAGLVALLPMVTLAAETDTTYITTALDQFKTIINTLIPIVIGLTILAFFWFLFKYVRGGGEDKEGAKMGMIWCIVAIVIMFSIYGIVNVVQGVFDVDNSGASLTIPEIPE
ncbi:MAG: hypothetical protein WC531_03045 [Candidatus Paceibacterota bacterium]|jgi:heme/copper-type cytochrome/quinol oxidase subunit 2